MSTLQVQFIMHLNKFKGLIYVFSLIQNITFFIYGELFTLSPCASSQIGQDPRSLLYQECFPRQLNVF